MLHVSSPHCSSDIRSAWPLHTRRANWTSMDDSCLNSGTCQFESGLENCTRNMLIRKALLFTLILARMITLLGQHVPEHCWKAIIHHCCIRILEMQHQVQIRWYEVDMCIGVIIKQWFDHGSAVNSLHFVSSLSTLQDCGIYPHILSYLCHFITKCLDIGVIVIELQKLTEYNPILVVIGGSHLLQKSSYCRHWDAEMCDEWCGLSSRIPIFLDSVPYVRQFNQTQRYSSDYQQSHRIYEWLYI